MKRTSQVRGSSCPGTLRNATLVAAAVAGCAHGGSGDHQVDAGGSGGDDAALSGPDAAPDAQIVSPDAGCAISEGAAPALDGNGDLAKYGSAQHFTLGAMMGSDDAAIVWDHRAIYVTMQSAAFATAYEPLHLYVEAVTGLGVPVPSQGKEYGGLVPQLAFTPTHVIGVRRVSDSGTGGPYDGVYTPASAWSTRATPLAEGSDVLVSSDGQTVSAIVPWSALGGCPTALRLTAHVVHGAVANEWKDLAPATATPWQAPGGGYYEIDLTGPTAVSGWAQH
jgi:hypothetical protein